MRGGLAVIRRVFVSIIVDTPFPPFSCPGETVPPQVGLRTNSQLIGIDNGVAKWGSRHASTTSMHALNDVTQLGGIYTIAVLCVILAVAETLRERSVWVAPFIVAVIGGEEIVTLTV